MNSEKDFWTQSFFISRHRRRHLRRRYKQMRDVEHPMGVAVPLEQVAGQQELGWYE